ncbi:hypothetical protein BT96DRAFT_1007111 [Gymnopus androsaceus JB14]|uniref:Uncharacterized protein n=1 Tax=Gymnopus androsaceus JB14 TaxID=1447944 RepID=A0A6A4GI52_9AGAR|nr:hypothetical protein BT96DRAFT_1007111 [Gymnopus androsaceus JB14]
MRSVSRVSVPPSSVSTSSAASRTSAGTSKTTRKTRRSRPTANANSSSRPSTSASAASTRSRSSRAGSVNSRMEIDTDGDVDALPQVPEAEEEYSESQWGARGGFGSDGDAEMEMEMVQVESMMDVDVDRDGEPLSHSHSHSRRQRTRTNPNMHTRASGAGKRPQQQQDVVEEEDLVEEDYEPTSPSPCDPPESPSHPSIVSFSSYDQWRDVEESIHCSWSSEQRFEYGYQAYGVFDGFDESGERLVGMGMGDAVMRMRGREPFVSGQSPQVNALPFFLDTLPFPLKVWDIAGWKDGIWASSFLVGGRKESASICNPNQVYGQTQTCTDLELRSTDITTTQRPFFRSMPSFRKPVARLIRDARKSKSTLYSKVAKSDIQQLLIAVKKQERAVSNSMDDGSPKCDGIGCFEAPAARRARLTLETALKILSII